MAGSSKVHWSEGLFLRPQHLQQWDLYNEALVQQRVSPLLAYGWGIVDLEIDAEALGNGRLSVRRVEAVLPGGTVIQAPEVDDLPPDRDIGPHFSTDRSSLEAYVGLPLLRPGVANVQQLHDPENPNARYVASARPIPDINTGNNQQEIQFLSKNLRILFSEEGLSDYDAIRIAELKRVAAGGFEPSESHAPPCLASSGSELIMNVLKDVLSRLAAKSDALFESAREASDTQLKYGDVNAFGLLNICNSYLPVLQHFRTVGRIHPETVYRSMASLASELCTFHAKIRPRDIPLYDHDRPAATFGRLHELLLPLMGITPDTGHGQVELRKEEDYLVGTIVNDKWLAPGTQYILSASADMDREMLTQSIPRKIKIGSRENIDQLVRRALAGVRVRPEPVPPGKVPRRMDACYFSLDTSGDMWELVRQAKNIAIYVPGDLQSVRFELYPVYEDQ